MKCLSLKQYAKTGRILVVDDIPDNSFLLQALLESEGYQVDVATSGRDALKKIAANPPELLLLDVMMPDMSGFEVTQRIREDRSLPFIPILLVTGFSERHILDQHGSGANGVVHKPVDLEALLQHVETLLKSPA